jgi:hypothetical protein
MDTLVLPTLSLVRTEIIEEPSSVNKRFTVDRDAGAPISDPAVVRNVSKESISVAGNSF